MHATRARLPQKRTRSKKSAEKKVAPKQAAPVSSLAAAAPSRVVSLAAHRSRRQSIALNTEIYALVEWIAPARESWRRGELEIRRSACMPMSASREGDGSLVLTDLPGQGDALRLEPATLRALTAGAMSSLVLTLPGMRVTVQAEDLLPVLPAPAPSARILAFPRRA